MTATTVVLDRHRIPEPEKVNSCFHCGEPLSTTSAALHREDTDRTYCCAGCAAAAHWIRDAHLDDYYRLRSAPAARAPVDDTDLALWDREDVLAEHACDVPGGRELTLLTDGMRCAACAWLIDRALAREHGVLEASANAVTGRIRVAWDPTRTRLSDVLRRLVTLGYRPFLATGEGSERERRNERNRWLLRLGVAGLGAMQAMMFTEALTWGTPAVDHGGTMSLAMRDFLRWVALLVSTPVVFYAGWPFLSGCMRELREFRFGMDTLIAMSTLLAYFGSVIETLRGGTQVWYDTAVMFVFLLLAARMLEQRVRSAATARVDALARARPAVATRERADGTREQLPLALLNIGDVVRVGVGEAVPADGLLLDAPASFEEALLTGESDAQHKEPGARVFAGTVCRERPARLRLTATGNATRLSQLTRLVEQAQAHRPPLAQAADRVASWFVAALIVVAVTTGVGWSVYDSSRAFSVTLALLVISCPCALSLAVPAALAAANAALAELGVLPLRADALQRLATIDDVVFDKTGTLSEGCPQIGQIDTFADMQPAVALRIASGLECDSGHPLAQAFRLACKAYGVTDVSAAHDVVAHPGMGIEGRIEGGRWRLGRAGFACDRADSDDVWLGDGYRGMARFEVRERERSDARQTLQALRSLGLSLHLSSGDSTAAVQRFAARCAITNAQARQSPEDKLAFVRRLQDQARRVAMIGDGINDAPVLAGADVSIAIGEGAALAQGAADLVLTSPSLARLPAAIGLARRTQRIVRQNFIWALSYNLIALPLAASGLVAPWMAALGMALSSLIVTLNALRLTRVGPGICSNPTDAMTTEMPA